MIWPSERFRYPEFSFHAASFSPFFLAAALQNLKELHEIRHVTVWRARLLSRCPGAICVSALGRKRCALLWKVRCAAIHSSAKGWWRCRCAGRANGGAERRSCGTSGFIDVQGAAAAKDVRQNHPNLILTFGPELGMMLLLQKVLGIEVLQDNWRRTARCSGKTLMRGMYTIQKT